MPSVERLDTAQSLAKFLNISVAAIRKWTRTCKLPVVHIGRAVRFDHAVILRALQNKQQALGWRWRVTHTGSEHHADSFFDNIPDELKSYAQ